MIKRDLQIMQVPNGDEICYIQLMKLIDKVTSTKVNPQIEKYLPFFLITMPDNFGMFLYCCIWGGIFFG